MDKTQQLVQTQQQEQLQNLLSLVGGGQNGQSSLLTQLQPMFQMLLTISILVSIAFLLFFVLHFIHKWRVESAILRIDKNLQKLVAVQVPEVVEEKPASSDKEEKEQK